MDERNEQPAPVEPVSQHLQGMRILALAIFVGCAMIAISARSWSGGGGSGVPDYQAFEVQGKMVRLDTDHGHLVACDFTKCVRILGNGKEVSPGTLDVEPAPKALAPAAAK